MIEVVKQEERLAMNTSIEQDMRSLKEAERQQNNRQNECRAVSSDTDPLHGGQKF
jgi:hypothetical protein